MIPIYKPFLDNYKKSAIKAIESEWISNYGLFVTLAEEKIKEITGSKFCILMNNGTSATHCLFLALKHKHPDINKIYVPNNVFISPWNCALNEYDTHCLEVMKINPKTLNIDTSTEYINSLEKNSCVLIVHNIGNVINVPRLKKLRPDIIFIEDNCEGFLGKYEDIYSGSFNGTLCSSVSFYANKTLTTGEGGAFFTNDKEIYKYIKNIYNHGMTNERYIHSNIAYNYRMTNIQAGFLYDQLNDIENILKIKKDIFLLYDKLFISYFCEGKIRKLEKEDNTTPALWMYSIFIPGLDYKDLEIYMNENRVQIRPIFYDIREHEHLKNIKVSYDKIDISSQGFLLPSFPGLSFEEIKYIANTVKNYIEIKH